MPKVNCAVIRCSNSNYRLNKWKKSVCEQHAPANKNDYVCAAPFKLFCFPSTLRNSRDRSKWVKLLRREIPGKKKWEPCNSERVCSIMSQQLNIMTQQKIWVTKTSQDQSQGGLCTSTPLPRKMYLNHRLQNTMTIQQLMF